MVPSLGTEESGLSVIPIFIVGLESTERQQTGQGAHSKRGYEKTSKKGTFVKFPQRRMDELRRQFMASCN